MELKDIQKEDKVLVVTTIRISKDDKKFIEDNNINVGLLVRRVLERLRIKNSKKTDSNLIDKHVPGSADINGNKKEAEQ